MSVKIEDTENLVLDKISSNRYKYIRIDSQISKQLSNKISSFHNNLPSIIVSSGMSAISTCLLAILSKHKGKKVNIIYSSEMYCETSSTIIWMANEYSCTHKMFGIKTHQKNLLEYIANLSKLNEESKPDINILFTESCSNPNGYLFDYSVIPELKAFGFEWEIIIDNTWLTHIIQNPFEKSSHVDYVLISLTKYYSGGNAIGGAIIAKNDTYYNSLRTITKIFGLHVSPVNCDIIFNNIDTICARISQSSKKTICVITKLIDDNRIKIYHPYTNYPLNYEKNDLVPSVFVVKLTGIKNNNKNDFALIVKKSFIEYKTSFGYHKSRIDPWIKFKKNGSVYNLSFRVSVGYNDNVDKVYSELKKIIDQVYANNKLNIC